MIGPQGVDITILSKRLLIILPPLIKPKHLSEAIMYRRLDKQL